MSFTFKMEVRALELAKLMCRQCPKWEHLYTDGCNVRPWFSSTSLFEKSAQRVFLATNPGGLADSNLKNLRLEPGAYDCGESDPDRTASPHNCWLDDVWAGSPPGRDKRQVPVQRAFEALYGSKWESILRNTPSFEVCPLRTANVNDLPEEVWSASIDWCRDVLEKIHPDTVITNGNGVGKSPWQAIKQMYGIQVLKKVPVNKNKSGSLKVGKLTSGKLKGAKIVGMPHLSQPQFRTPRLYEALRCVGQH